jgi:hypothetical protein
MNLDVVTLVEICQTHAIEIYKSQIIGNNGVNPLTGGGKYFSA